MALGVDVAVGVFVAVVVGCGVVVALGVGLGVGEIVGVGVGVGEGEGVAAIVGEEVTVTIGEADGAFLIVLELPQPVDTIRIQADNNSNNTFFIRTVPSFIIDFDGYIIPTYDRNFNRNLKYFQLKCKTNEPNVTIPQDAGACSILWGNVHNTILKIPHIRAPRLPAAPPSHPQVFHMIPSYTIFFESRYKRGICRSCA